MPLRQVTQVSSNEGQQMLVTLLLLQQALRDGICVVLRNPATGEERQIRRVSCQEGEDQ